MMGIAFGSVCCGFICLREIFGKDSYVSTYVLVMQIFLGLMGAVGGCGAGLILLIYGEVGTTAWDNMCMIENLLNTGN